MREDRKVAGREGQREFHHGCGRGLGRGEPEKFAGTSLVSIPLKTRQ